MDIGNRASANRIVALGQYQLLIDCAQLRLADTDVLLGKRHIKVGLRAAQHQILLGHDELCLCMLNLRACLPVRNPVTWAYQGLRDLGGPVPAIDAAVFIRPIAKRCIADLIAVAAAQIDTGQQGRAGLGQFFQGGFKPFASGAVLGVFGLRFAVNGRQRLRPHRSHSHTHHEHQNQEDSVSVHAATPLCSAAWATKSTRSCGANRYGCRR